MQAIPQKVADRVARRVDAYVDPSEKRNPRVLKASELCSMQKQRAVANAAR